MTRIQFGHIIILLDNKEQVMYSREFRELPVGRLFRCNGNDYFKQSTRTARRLANGRVIYFGKSEIIHPIAY
ncbi:MAG: hypothetical protein EBX67_06440 [Betaproteobacteria bacterium]|nr:hypothetical protein [Betaproteobacteria bacterium]NDA70687.1 hypothetical protein [Betaproteobacteria bacterium]NDH35099.1 hypothetical protein [Betaproteobacteria bacterium]